MSKEGDALINPIVDYMQRYSYCSDIARTKIIPAELGNNAGVVGAAMLWKQGR